MKLPVLAIATAFALGIACGLEIAHRSNSHQFIALLLCSASTSLLIGMFFVWRSRMVAAGLASLLCWVMLGVAAVCIEEQPRRVDHILSLLDAGKINIKSPLRYAIAALLPLVARPSALGDSSFQLSFLAIGCIGGLALPWLDGTVQPYARALRRWRDVTKDVSYDRGRHNFASIFGCWRTQ